MWLVFTPLPMPGFYTSKIYQDLIQETLRDQEFLAALKNTKNKGWLK
jgi:hypothetical protein